MIQWHERYEALNYLQLVKYVQVNRLLESQINYVQFMFDFPHISYINMGIWFSPKARYDVQLANSL